MTARQIVTGGLALAALFALAAPTAAQQDSTRARRAVPLSAEGVLGMRARLGLSPDQITRLSRLRQEAVASRQQELTAMLELRSRLQAGDITRDQFLAEAGKRRQALRETASGRSERIGSVLTDAQREQITSQRREMMRQRLQASRGGRGMRGERGLRGPERGMRGPRGAAPPRERIRPHRGGRPLEGEG